MKPTDPRQRQLLEELQTGASLIATDELVEEPLEQFKSHLLDCISRLAGKSGRDEESKSPPVVFLVCQPEDEDAALGLRKTLFAQGLEVRMPEFEGSDTTQREAFAHHSATADAVLVYFGAAPESWVVTMLDSLNDWRQLGRKRPLPTRAVLIGGQPSPRKKNFSSHRVDLVADALGQPESQALQEFIERVLRG